MAPSAGEGCTAWTGPSRRLPTWAWVLFLIALPKEGMGFSATVADSVSQIPSHHIIHITISIPPCFLVHKLRRSCPTASPPHLSLPGPLGFSAFVWIPRPGSAIHTILFVVSVHTPEGHGNDPLPLLCGWRFPSWWLQRCHSRCSGTSASSTSARSTPRAPPPCLLPQPP